MPIVGTKSRVIYDVIKEYGEPLTRTEIRKLANVPTENIGGLLHNLVRSGSVACTTDLKGRNVYTIPAPVSSINPQPEPIITVLIGGKDYMPVAEHHKLMAEEMLKYTTPNKGAELAQCRVRKIIVERNSAGVFTSIVVDGDVSENMVLGMPVTINKMD